jgi:hypothetical protein
MVHCLESERIEEYSVWISLSSACSGPSGSSSLFSGVFIAEEVGGAGDNGSGDTTTVDIQTLLEAILNKSLRVGTVDLKKYWCFWSFT